MHRWQNWSGRRVARPSQLTFARSEADVQATVLEATKTGSSVRVAGAGHSHSPIVVGADVLIDVSGLAGVVDTQSEASDGQALIRAGSSIFSLGLPLFEKGLALKNQGDIDRQTLGGAVSTGTHGTGRTLKNMSASVVGLDIILCGGEQVSCSAAVLQDLFQVARLSIGSVGVLTKLKMQLAPVGVIKEHGWRVQFDELIDQIPTLIATNERFEFFWYPGSDEAVIKTINPSDKQASYPLGEEGKRAAWSHEVLPNHRPHLHTEMEYSVPEEDGPACFTEIRRLLRTHYVDVKWPVEYRTVAQDDIWLSMATGRPTVTISVHQDIAEDEEPYYRACEEIFLSYGGRPHWGKVNYLSGRQFQQIYPEWEQWWALRNQFDPTGMFLNEYMRILQPD